LNTAVLGTTILIKCGSIECDICKPHVRLPKDIFNTIHFLPDPVPGEDGHYKTLEQLLCSVTDESHRSSLQTKAKRTKTLPLTASVSKM